MLLSTVIFITILLLIVLLMVRFFLVVFIVALLFFVVVLLLLVVDWLSIIFLRSSMFNVGLLLLWFIKILFLGVIIVLLISGLKVFLLRVLRSLILELFTLVISIPDRGFFVVLLILLLVLGSFVVLPVLEMSFSFGCFSLVVVVGVILGMEGLLDARLGLELGRLLLGPVAVVVGLPLGLVDLLSLLPAALLALSALLAAFFRLSYSALPAHL